VEFISGWPTVEETLEFGCMIEHLVDLVHVSARNHHHHIKGWSVRKVAGITPFRKCTLSVFLAEMWRLHKARARDGG